jgi:hypothetical protein
MVVIAFLEFATLDTCLCQTYYFTGGVGSGAGGSGYQEIPFADPGNPNYGGSGNGNGGGKFPGSSGNVDFGPLNGRLIHDPVANTLELLGNVGISGWNGSGFFSDNQTINGVLVPATVSVNYTVGNVDDAAFSFDTGAVPFNPAGPAYSFDVPLPISGSYSLVTGGETYSGSYSYTLDISTAVHYSVINSNCVDFSMDTVGGFGEDLYVPLAQITADNGIQVDLTAEDPSDGVTYREWHVDNVVAVVPEPSASEMLLLAFSGLGLYVWRRGSARRCCNRYK